MSSDDASPHRQLLSTVYQYGRPHARYFVGGTIASLFQRTGRFVPPLIVGVAIDAILLQREPFGLPLVPAAWYPETLEGQAAVLLVMLLVIYPIAAIGNMFARRLLGRFGQYVQHDIRVDTFDTVQRLEMGYFERAETGQVMSILNDDVRALGGAVSGVFQRLVHNVSYVVVMFVILLTLNWQLTLTLLYVPLLLAVFVVWVSDLLEAKNSAYRERLGAINDRLNVNVEGISTIKSYGREEYERDRIADVSRDYMDARWDLTLTEATFQPLTTLVARTGRLLVLVVGGYWILQGPPLFYSGTMTVGTLFVFHSYVGKFTEPINQLADSIEPYTRALAASNRIQEATDGDELEVREGATDLENVDGAVTYENVEFTYPGRERPTADDVTFSVAPGETVGVVGPTGSGKSTLVKLLFRYYDPDDGRITIDGHDIHDVSVESLRDSLGYVSQEPFLFSGTVRENLLYGDPDVTETEMIRAAKRAGAHEFVTELPEGYDTTVGERGTKLSGGQRQRVTIAREILRSPPILVLDEATSHVDNETEVLIQRAMDQLGADRTMFVIAHRLSSVRDADQILVMDDGRLIEQGTHEELLAADGMYANLWRIQVGDVDSLSAEFLERVQRQEDIAL